MDGSTYTQPKRFPRSLKNIQPEARTESSSIINVNALFEKNSTNPLPSIKKIEPNERKDDPDPIEKLGFK